MWKRVQKSKKKPTSLRPNRGRPQRKRASVLRTGPARDPKYRAFVRTWTCVVCRITAEMGSLFHCRVEAAHTGPHGISQKASDHTCVPLCRKHHTELDHQIGKAFWKKYGLNRTAIISQLRAQYAAERTK